MNDRCALTPTAALERKGDDICSARQEVPGPGGWGGPYLCCRGPLVAAPLGEVVEAFEGGEQASLALSVSAGQRTPPERSLISGTDLNR